MPDCARVLIIDDEQVIRDGCERSLSGNGYSVSKAENGENGIQFLKADIFDVVLLDLMMPGIDGFEVLSWIREHHPSMPVVVITGFATVDKAVLAMKQGAFDFVGKPFTPDYIRIVVKRALEKRALQKETEKLKSEKALDLMTIIEEQSRLKTVFGCMMEAVLITNREGIVVHHNPAAVKVLQIETDPFIGKSLKQSISDQKLVKMVCEALEQAKHVTREFEPGTISRMYLRAHSSPVQTSEGTILGAVTVFEDITTHKMIDQQKSEFVAMVAHELRAPLASVEQMIYAMKAGCSTFEGTACEHLHTRMTARTKELLQLIANLLSLSRLESENIVFNLEAINGNTLLENIVEVLTPQAQNKNIALTLSPAEVDWTFNADFDHIRSAFINVMGNAVKYTPEGGQVEVKSKVSSGLVTIEISDTGIGIEKDSLPHIFDRFFRVKDKTTRLITGSGLGLSVVKKVVEAHNGFVDVVSEHGAGTTFSLSFPLASNSISSNQTQNMSSK